MGDMIARSSPEGMRLHNYRCGHENSAPLKSGSYLFLNAE